MVGTMALGFGGGVLLTDAFVGKSDNPRTLIERRNAPLPETPPVVAATTAYPEPVPQQAQPEQRAPARRSVTAEQDVAQQPDQATAAAQDAQVRKAQATGRRREERRKWAARRRQENRKLEELDAVAEKVRQAEQQREPAVRSFVADSPRIVLPGVDD